MFISSAAKNPVARSHADMLGLRRGAVQRVAVFSFRTLLTFTGRLALALSLAGVASALHAQSWRTASRAPAGLAPDPATTREAVVQVYAARAVSWRGYFGVHTWIAVKPTGADQFTVHEVLGYQQRRTGNAVRSSQRVADMYWYGNRPTLLADVRGRGVDAMIERIGAAVASYPFPKEYRVWPGPNSNTFTAHVLRAVPELRVDLPANAVGKDYLGERVLARTPSGTGAQLSLLGAAGILVGWDEGVEINFIGLTFGVNPSRLALKLPMLGNVGVIDYDAPRALDANAAAGSSSPSSP